MSSTIMKTSSSAQREPMFPVEIFNLIHQFLLPNKDYATLRACSLVCRSFVHLARQKIFHSAEIERRDGQLLRGCNRLQELLKNQPSIAQHVQELCFRFDASEEDIIDKGLEDPLNHLLDLPRIRSLSVEYLLTYDDGIFPSCQYDLDVLPVRLLKSHLVNLTNLALRGVFDLPITSILSAPNLTTLDIDECTIDPSSSQDAVTYQFALKHFKARRFEPAWLTIISNYCSQLESIDVEDSDYDFYGDQQETFVSRVAPSPFSPTLQIVTHRDSQVDFSYLCQAAEDVGAKAFPGVRTLHVYLGWFDRFSICGCTANQLLNHLPQLETLIIRDGETISSTSVDAFSSLDVNQGLHFSLPYLKNISITWQEGSNPLNETSVIRSLVKFLRLVQGRNVIESIELSMSSRHSEISRPTHATNEFGQPAPSVWGELDETLLEDRVRHFPSLRRVALVIDLSTTKIRIDDESRERLGMTFKEPMQRLSSSDIAFQYTIKPPRRKTSDPRALLLQQWHNSNAEDTDAT